MKTRKWIVSSEAGDGINGKAFADLESAKTAVMAAMLPDGDWDEVPGEPDSPENAWEYFAYDKNSVSGPDARIEFARAEENDMETKTTNYAMRTRTSPRYLIFTGQFKDEAAAALRTANLPVVPVPIIGGDWGSFLAGYEATREDLAAVGYGLSESQAMPGIYWVRPL